MRFKILFLCTECYWWIFLFLFSYALRWRFFFFSLPQAKKMETPWLPALLWTGWIICMREISVSWGLGHWQSRLLIAVLWDVLSVSMSTLNPHNCPVPIWLFIFHALWRAIIYKLQAVLLVSLSPLQWRWQSTAENIELPVYGTDFSKEAILCILPKTDIWNF